MALCRTCRTVIPCHCHLAPPVEVRPGVYLTPGRTDANGSAGLGLYYAGPAPRRHAAS